MTAIDELRDVLRWVRRRWFWSVWLQAFAAMVLAVAILVGLGVLTVRLAGITGDLRLVIAGMMAALAAAIVSGIVWQLPRRPSDAQVARFIEEQVPELDDTLVSAEDLERRDAAGPLGDLVLRDAARRVTTLDLDRVVSRRELRSRLGGLAAAVAVLIAVSVVVRRDVVDTWRQASLRLFPPTLTLVVAPGDATVVENESLVVTARVEGRPDDLPLDGFELRVLAGPTARGFEMASDGAHFRAEVPRVRQAFSYRVSGPLTSKTYHVRVQRPPRVARIDVAYKYPGYSGLSPRVDDDSGDVYAPAGTEVTLTVHTLDAVGAGRLAFDSGEALALAPTGPRALQAGFTVQKDSAYRVALTDPAGLASRGDTEYFVRVMTDRPPDVRLTRPGGDQKVTRLEEVVLEARADDDYGVASLDVVYSTKGGPEKVVPLHRGAPATTTSGSYVLRIEDLDVDPGDFVTAYARARDVSRGKRSTEARSDIFFFEVRPFNQEFEAAQSNAMAGAGGGSPTDLAAQQKEVIVATWKLQRRATAGRSADDIRAVARAQAEIRARAERLAPRQPLRRVVRPGPGQPGAMPQGTGNPFQDAIDAMGKAQRELEALNTNAAIPHEMAALNALLKADAENQRRQVATQQQGGRGGNTGNQDLSALFDRELQRQLKNNYENRASAEERREETQSDALDKLKELAQRQDELARQQRELARQQARLQQEEVKRQLERLTREQDEVRRQLEKLSQEMGGQQSAQQGAGGQPSPQGGQQRSQRLGDALEEMRRAMADMQRADPGQAGQRSAQAVDRMRSAARDMEQPAPGDGERAAGDLELEARELADSERRVANEVGRSGQGSTSADDLRRLGSEQAGLADRAEQLERRARQLASSGGAPADAGRKASQALGQLEVSDSMRDTAQQLREAARKQQRQSQQGQGTDRQRQQGQGQQGQGTDLSRIAESAEQMAKRLEAAADALGRGAGRDREAARLSDQLARTRALRDRLDAAERRIEELSRNASSERTGNTSEQGPAGGRAETGQQGREQQGPQGEAQGQGRAQGQNGRRSQESTGRGENRGSSDRSREQGPAETSPSPQSQPLGQRGAGGNEGSGTAAEIGRLQQQYARDAKQARELADALRDTNPDLARRLTTPEAWEPSVSAPGTEAFKQDFARWDVLRRDVRLALESLEASLARRLNDETSHDRLEAGPDQRTPDAYRRRVDKYYESLARPPQ